MQPAWGETGGIGGRAARTLVSAGFCLWQLEAPVAIDTEPGVQCQLTPNIDWAVKHKAGPASIVDPFS